MRIGIASPLTIKLLNIDTKGKILPSSTGFPMGSMLVNGLLSRGYKVVVYTSLPKIDKPLVIEDNNLTLCVGRSFNHPGRNLFKHTRKDLLELMQAYPSDIINAQWSYQHAWAALDSGIPTIVTLRDHATTILKYQPDLFRMARWLMNYNVVRRANHLITNSQYLFDLLSKKNQEKAIIINNFYGTDFEKNYTQQQRKNFIVTVANGFNRRKNIDSALLAFALVRKKFPQIEYHLIGDDMGPNGLAFQFALKHGITDGVVFRGLQPFNEVVKTVSEAKVLLHSSREETFGMSVLESMLIGTPVVGGEKSGNIPALLKHQQTGMLCNVDSPEDVANKVIELLTNENLAKSVQETGYKFASENFSENVIIDKLVNHYHNIFEKYKKQEKVF